MAAPRISVLVPVYNDEAHITACIASVLAQTVPDFELIIVDDCSTDRTAEMIRSFADPRIRYLRNEANYGEPASRNRGLQQARGEFVFFVDADCVAATDWLETGLRTFASGDFVGLEGKLYFVSPDYKPVYSDRVVENLTGGEYMTANMAYRADALRIAGPFDPALRRYCDSDMAFRVRRQGAIKFVDDMVVIHALSKWSPRSYFNYARAIAYDVALYKRHGRWYNVHGRVYAPEKLLAILFPPLVLAKLALHRFRTVDDFLLLLLMYPRLVYERVLLWQNCLRQRVFLL